MRKTSAREVVVLLSAIIFVFAMARSNVVAATIVPDFAPGQEWSIKSTSPTTAKIIIGRVERWGDKLCVNVSIVDIPIPQGMRGAGGVTEIAHIPFDKAALTASVDKLFAIGVAPSSNFESGYKQWQDAKGGIFTISVEKAIELMFQTINRQPNGQRQG